MTQGQFLGQNDFDPSVSIGNEAQSCLNVETSLNGSALRKRDGYTRIGSLPVSTSPATGATSFIDTSGNKQQVVCSDHYCSKSTNGGGFTTFLSTAGGSCMPTRWSFAQNLGNLYGANDCHDAVFQYNGTTFISLSTGAPLGSLLEATKDRLVISGVAATPSSVYYSQSGVFNNFITGILSASAYTDPIGANGDQVRALKYALGRLFIFKTNSITTCILGDQYTSKCYPVSNTIGTIDPNSVVEVPAYSAAGDSSGSGALLFRGSDNNFWRLDGGGLTPISKKILNLVKSQNSGSTQSNTQTGKTAWDAGTQFPTGSWNTTSAQPGVRNSSITFADNTTSKFQAGQQFYNIDSTTTANAIQLTSTTVQDNFSNNIVAGRLAWDQTGSPNAWSHGGTCHNISGQKCIRTYNGGDTVTVWPATQDTAGNFTLTTSSLAVSSGSLSFSWYTYGSGANANTCINSAGLSSFIYPASCWSVRLMSSAGSYYALEMIETAYNTNPHVLQVVKYVSPSTTTLTTYNYTLNNSNPGDKFTLEISTDSRFFVRVNDVYVASTTADATISPISKLNLVAFGQRASAFGSEVGYTINEFTSFYFFDYSSSGTFVSKIFDTQFSTPTFGPLSSTFSITMNNIESQTDFYIYTSTSPNNDLWAAKVASSDTVKIGISGKLARYVKYEADLYTKISTKTPNISAVGLSAATTGQLVTQCISPGSAISAWGQLSCGTSLGGNGSVVFYATSAVSCAALPATPPKSWAGGAQTNNATLGIATSSSVYIGFESLLGSATDYAQINTCTLNWQNGSATPPTWGTYDPFLNSVYWNIAINNSATANRVLKYDMNLNQWFPFGLNATALYRDSNFNSIYFGESASGFWNQYGGGVTSDNGSNINAFWISRDFGNSTYPFVDNTYTRISMVGKNEPSGSVNVTYEFNNGSTGTYTMSVSTTSTWNYVHMNQALLQASPFQFININVGNNSTTPFEIDAMAIDFTSFGWQPQNP